MKDKEFKTLEEQIAILESRGLDIPNRDAAKQFLLDNNYYRVSGYSLTLRNHDKFYEKTTFQNIVDIYSFDHELRHILMKYIEQIEVRLKSIFAYEFSRVYGGTGYLTSNNFTNHREYIRIINKANELKEQRLSNEAYLKHYVEELQRPIPLWAYVDLLTIGDISMLYQIAHEDVKKAVALGFGLTMKDGPAILGEYMHGLTIVRNLCAHGSRLFNRLFIRKPSLNSKEKALLIKDNDGIVDNSRLYGYMLTMRRLLHPEDFSEMKNAIIATNKKYPFVAMRYYGFREDWETML